MLTLDPADLSLLKKLPLAITISEKAGGRFLFATPLAAKIFSTTVMELEGSSAFDLYSSPEERAHFLRGLEQEGKVRDREMFLNRKDGIRVWVLVSMELGYFGSKEVVYTFFSDISQRKESLENAETRLQALLDQLEVGVFLLDESGRFLDFNPALLDLFGYKNRELSGKNFDDLFPPQGHFQQLLLIMEGKGFLPDHLLYFQRKEKTIVFVVRATLVRNAAGDRFIHGILRDVTARIRQDQQFQHLLESAPEAMVAFNDQDIIVLANSQAQQLFGYTQAEFLGLDIKTLMPEQHHPDHYRRWERFQHNPSRKIATLTRMTALRKDGSEFPIEVTLGPFLGEKGTWVLCGIRDISERRRLEEQFFQAQKMEAIGRLGGGIAHDFNNILTAVLSFTHLALEEIPPGSQPFEDLQEVLKASDRARSLTNQLLAFSRRQMVQPQAVNLNEQITSTHKLLRRLLGEDIELVTIPFPNLWTVSIDPNQCEQLLINLALNARDAMPRGGKLTIETKNMNLDEDYTNRHAGVQPGEYVMIAVSDTGTGMPLEVREHIFEPFFTTKEPGKGTGLGLAMVYGVVKQAGGIIWVYSEVGMGTSFKVYLPRVEGEPDLPGNIIGSDTGDRGTETVLVVEDEKQVRDVVVRTLEKKGYTILKAEAGDVGLQAAREFSGTIDLLLTDMVMPRMSGTDLARELLADRPGLKVLLMSGYTDNSLVHSGLLPEGIHFLQKPFLPAALAKKIRQVLDTA